MKIFDGRKEADRILSDLKRKIKQRNISPRLAVILVGEDKPTLIYIKKKMEAAEKIGARFSLFQFKGDVKESGIVRKIDELNKDKDVNGVLVQLPLPQGFKTGNITSRIDAKKDVDGFVSSYFSPVLPQAILCILKKTKADLKKKRIAALVNSDVFKEGLEDFFEKKGIKINCFRCKDKSCFSKLKYFDIIISVCGKGKMIKKEIIKNNTILIDAGFSYTKDGKVVGDIDKDSVKDKASFLTPVPGGVGPMTVAFIMKNLYLSTTKKYESK